MYDDLIPISHISQYEYCKRRVALILLERQWEENIHTSEGTIIHERVHSGLQEHRSNIITLRGVDLVSYTLGLIGVSNCIELKRSKDGYRILGLSGKWIIYPVEYKHGVVRNEPEYELQLCSQAMCLEEMCKCEINSGYIFYEADHRRHKVIFDDNKRKRVQEIANELHKMIYNQATPKATKTRKCKECSMQKICMPGKLKDPSAYIEDMQEKAGVFLE